MFDIFYLDQPTGLFPHEQYAESIEDAAIKSRTRSCWIVNYLCDYTGFDFLWEPIPHQRNQAHVWPSQHQQNSGTWLIPRIPGSIDVNRDHSIVPRIKSAPRLHIKHNHTSPDAGDINTRYISDYLGTMRRALSKVDWEYCWVTADVCDYSNFDFTWHPSEWQLDMLHVFPSGEQQFGDTFYVHVPSFLEKTQDLKILEWVDTLNFVSDISVPRYPMPIVKYTTDSVVPAIWEYEFTDPVVQFYRDDVYFDPIISLWQEKTKTVVTLSRGGGSIVVPRECKNYLKTQVYDYPYIDKSIQDKRNDRLLDIVFMSNGEVNADINYSHVRNSGSGYGNRVTRVDRVKGRVASQHACAEAAETDWYFVVPAKLELNYAFDFTWKPDRMQQPKHYIFHARNPVNGLTYGHMAIVAYNKKLVLATQGNGLDFTMEQPHEVVPMLSGYATYHHDPMMCWRTAFRECIKLKHSLPDIENEYRLQQWLTVNNMGEAVCEEGVWSIRGAEDAVEYYESVNGDIKELMKSYEWDWLASYAFIKRGLTSA